MKYDIGSRKKVKVNELSGTKFSLWVVFKNLASEVYNTANPDPQNRISVLFYDNKPANHVLLK